jgi:hypothetical protein
LSGGKSPLPDWANAFIQTPGKPGIFAYLFLLKIPNLFNYKNLYKALDLLSKIKIYRNIWEQHSVCLYKEAPCLRRRGGKAGVEDPPFVKPRKHTSRAGGAGEFGRTLTIPIYIPKLQGENGRFFVIRYSP